jgi:hypothetical protein
MKLDNGGRCQNRVKPGKGPCWRHANGFWRKIQSFAQNETKTFVLGTVLSLAGVVGAFYGGSHINLAQTTGPNSPAINGNGTVINYGATPRPWVAIRDPALANTVQLSERGFDAWVRLPLENTSATPAVAAVGASLFFVTDNHPKAGIEKAQDDLCESIHRHLESEDTMISTVFRGTQQIVTTTAVHADRKVVDEAIQLMTKNYYSPEREFIPVIISCVVYRATTGKEYFRSAYANQVSRFVCKEPTDTVCGMGCYACRKQEV